jgi:hypothetical protein
VFESLTPTPPMMDDPPLLVYMSVETMLNLAALLLVLNLAGAPCLCRRSPDGRTTTTHSTSVTTPMHTIITPVLAGMCSVRAVHRLVGTYLRTLR